MGGFLRTTCKPKHSGNGSKSFRQVGLAVQRWEAFGACGLPCCTPFENGPSPRSFAEEKSDFHSLDIHWNPLGRMKFPLGEPFLLASVAMTCEWLVSCYNHGITLLQSPVCVLRSAKSYQNCTLVAPHVRKLYLIVCPAKFKTCLMKNEEARTWKLTEVSKTQAAHVTGHGSTETA